MTCRRDRGFCALGWWLLWWPGQRELAPGGLEQLRAARASDARDPEEGQPQFRRSALQLRHAFFIVERIDLVRGDNLRLRGERGLKELELAAHGVEVVDGVASAGARDVHEVNQHLRALEVTQKLVAKAEASMRTLDQPRHVGNHKAAILAESDHAEIGCQRRERVVGDLWSRR